MVSLSERRRTDCTDAEWVEYCNMSQVRTNETPSEWMNRIWPRLQYFRENDLLPTNSNKYLEARKLITYWSEVNGFYTSYAPEIGMERHWTSHCTGNKYCGVSYEEYQKIIQKPKSARKYDDDYALHRYGLWMQNAIKKIQRAREIGKKIRACTIIQRKFIEYMYRPDGLCASGLALHYQLLWAVREEMRQANNV